jgi:phenylacetate-CoA ligase
MLHEHTSGTTGTPLDLWSKRETVRTWYALCEARWRWWYGVSRHDRWAIVGGQLVVPIWQRRPPYWVRNTALRQLYLSAYHLSANSAAQYADALRRFRPRYLLGYTSGLAALAQLTGATALEALGLQVVVANAEPLDDHERAEIRRAFGCPVRETYGMSEQVAAASECEAGKMHLWPEVGVLEVLDGTERVQAGVPGAFVCTGLLNPDMPLIRYQLGDRGAVAADVPCACRRGLPRLAHVEGRADDVLYMADGRRIGRLDPVFKSQLGIREAQIVQESLGQIRVLVVPASTAGSVDRASIASRLRARVGDDVEVLVVMVDAIPRTSNGKFRAVLCQLSEAERRQAAHLGRPNSPK